MSYGRLDWRNWEKEQTRTVTQKAKLFDELCTAALEWQKWLIQLLNPKAAEYDKLPFAKQIAGTELWQKLHPKNGDSTYLEQKHKHNVWQWLRGRERAIQGAQNRVKRFSETFELIRDKPGHFPGGEEMPVKFEIAQQLHSELDLRATLFLFPNAGADAETFEKLEKEAWPGARFAERTDAPVEGLQKYFEILDKHKDELGVHAADFGKAGNGDPDKDEEGRYIGALKNFWRLNQRPEAQLDFETLSKTLLVDECPHAAILLRRGLLKDKDRGEIPPDEDVQLSCLERELGVFDQFNQRRDIKGIREDPQRYRVLTPFQFDRAQILMDRAKADQTPKAGHWTTYLEHVKHELGEYLTRTEDGDISRQYLTPSSRYLTALSLSLLTDPYGALGVDEDGKMVDTHPPIGEGGKVREDTSKKVAHDDPGHPLGPPTVTRFSGRRSILAERFDPMPKIHRDLKISLYITTNYDFEIERYFQDIGFRDFDEAPKTSGGQVDQPGPTDSDMRRDELGRVLRDRSFAPENAAQLTTFAMASGESGADIMHLHGRATKTDGLVITERDCMRLYLTDDEYRPTIDEGIQIAFSGAPLLFLGLGMEETDLLRPLRQFISNRDRTIGYTSIALLPAEKALAARTKFSASLYMRYGVHTVFYGSGQLPYQNAKDKDGENKQFPLDWLHRIIELCGGLRDELGK